MAAVSTACFAECDAGHTTFSELSANLVPSGSSFFKCAHAVPPIGRQYHPTRAGSTGGQELSLTVYLNDPWGLPLSTINYDH